MENFVSIAFTLFLAIDALGTLPVYLAQVEKLGTKKYFQVAIRELCFALILMVAFLFLGEVLIRLLGVSRVTVELAGGVLLLMIAIRLIFSHEDHSGRWKKGAPFIVPIATPLLAGPSFFAVVTIFGQAEVSNYVVFASIVTAWAASAIVYLFGRQIFRLIGDRGLLACQRLMGLLIALVAVQLFLEGIRNLIASGL